jgi:hypothetical protein
MIHAKTRNLEPKKRNKLEKNASSIPVEYISLDKRLRALNLCDS